MKKIFILFTLTYLILSINSKATNEESPDKLKIGILLPLSGEFKEIGKPMLNVIKLAIFDLGDKNILAYPKDSGSNSKDTFEAAKEFEKDQVKIVLGPLFYENLEKLEEIEDVTFLSLTNKTGSLPKNTIALGININSQLIKINEYLVKNGYSKTLLLIPKSEFQDEITLALSRNKLNFHRIYFYDTNPKTITKEIEEITLYKERRNNLLRRIKILEKSEKNKDKAKLEKLKQKYTLGKVNFDSVVIADFGERLKSVVASFAFSDVSSKDVKFFTLNQWFDESFFNETFLDNLHFPSIDKTNFERFLNKYKYFFNEMPPEISILAYDTIGLIYYAWKKNKSKISTKDLNIKYGFKGQQGEFIIKNNISYQKLIIYKIENKKFIRVE